MMATLIDLLGRLWRSTASVIALVLIVAAFIAGLMLGGGDDKEEPVATPVAGDGAAQEYTCSMHPQVRLPDPKAKCPICFMDLIPVTAGSTDEPVLAMSEAAMKLAEIQTTAVVRMFPTHDVRMFGTIDYDETRVATIAAYFPGRLVRLFVDYTGVRVNADEHLARIYSPELATAHVELRQAVAAVQDPGTSAAVLPAARARLEAAREKLRLWGLAEDQIKDLESSEEPTDELTILSPISGVVIRKMAQEGRYVETGDEIYEVADLDHLWVRLQAYESQLPWLRFGQDVEFTTDSLPGRSFHGRISFIEPIVDPATRTVRVRLNVENTEGLLKPGLYVRAVARSKIAGHGLVIDESLAGKWISPMHPEIIKDGPGECDVCGMPLVPVEELGYVARSDMAGRPLIIPASAPLITGRRAVVYVRLQGHDQPTFEGREVILGPRAGDHYIVEEGLAEGDLVVVNGAFKIDSALQLMARPSMMSAPATPPAPQRLDTPALVVQSMKPVFSAYFRAQEALAGDDLDGFRRAVGDMQDALGFVETTGVVGEPLGVWRRLERSLRTDAEAVAGLDDIEGARRTFETYSKAIIELEERYGHLGTRAYYVTHCPMAFDNKGASWLARTDEVANPYFGSSMLRCGTVTLTSEPREMGGDAP